MRKRNENVNINDEYKISSRINFFPFQNKKDEGLKSHECSSKTQLAKHQLLQATSELNS